VTVPYDGSIAVARPPQSAGILGFGGGFGGMGLLGARLDTERLGVADPSDAVLSAPFQTLFVAAAGSDRILGYNAKIVSRRAKATTDRVPGPSSQFGWGGRGIMPAEITFPVPPPIVIPTQSNPRGLAISDDGRLIVVSNSLSDSLTVIAFDGVRARVVRHIPLGGPPADAARRGQVLFHSSRMTFNGRFSCASCHPGGGSDGRVWDTPAEDPGPRRTKPLLGVKDTAPYGWRGDSPTLADRVRKTIRKLHRGSPSPGQVNDLVAYLASLAPPAKKAVGGRNREKVELGRSLFEGKARCGRCHNGDSLQDGDVHDIGSGGLFRTPSLRGVAGRSPLMHDGRGLSVESMFRQYNKEKRHGAAQELTPDELDALFTYMKTM
jgi:mono/diheme cytochrome c family protein